MPKPASARDHIDAARASLEHVQFAEDGARRTEDLAEALAHATIALAISADDTADRMMMEGR